MPILAEVIFPVVALVAIGYGAARSGRFSDAAARAMSEVTFLVFMPALLFGSLARADFASLSPGAAFAYYGAGLPLFAAAMVWQARRAVAWDTAVIQSLSIVFSNTAMLGIPLVRLVWGDAGLSLLLTIIALHSLTFLTLGTLLIELSRARGSASAAGRGLALQVLRVARASLLHPVVAPILAGLAWSAAGLGLPRFVEIPLGMLAAAAAPLCLVLLGVSLAQFGFADGIRQAVTISAMKAIAHPLAVWVLGKFVLGLDPLALAVATVAAALPIGANVYLFAVRYDAAVARVSAGVSLSTTASVVTLPVVLWMFGAG
jgi:malonate transporter and related proteins